MKDIGKELDEIDKALKSITLISCAYCFRSNGTFTLTSTKIAPPDPDKIIRYIVSDKRVDSKDPLLAHKTTKRKLFDEEWVRANKQHGADEVLFLNERGELTEGSRSTLFLKRGEKYPDSTALSCGLLHWYACVNS